MGEADTEGAGDEWADDQAGPHDGASSAGDDGHGGGGGTSSSPTPGGDDAGGADDAGTDDAGTDDAGTDDAGTDDAGDGDGDGDETGGEVLDLCDQPGDLESCGVNGIRGCVDQTVAGDTEPTFVWGECYEDPECRPDVPTHIWCDSPAGYGTYEYELPCTFDGAAAPEWGYQGCPPTPLVLSGASTPIPQLAPHQDGLEFTLTNDNRRECATDWPRTDSPWLALDRDGDGQINTGVELFGSMTPMADGTTATNGFEALAELDSNQDGQITPADARFSELRAWADADGDRITDSGELIPLSELEVDVIDLRFTVDRQCDARGNCGVERSTFSSPLGGGQVIDLHLPCR
jgi:hypothetical protein